MLHISKRHQAAVSQIETLAVAHPGINHEHKEECELTDSRCAIQKSGSKKFCSQCAQSINLVHAKDSSIAIQLESMNIYHIATPQIAQ